MAFVAREQGDGIETCYTTTEKICKRKKRKKRRRGRRGKSNRVQVQSPSEYFPPSSIFRDPNCTQEIELYSVNWALPLADLDADLRIFKQFKNSTFRHNCLRRWVQGNRVIYTPNAGGASYHHVVVKPDVIVYELYDCDDYIEEGCLRQARYEKQHASDYRQMLFDIQRTRNEWYFKEGEYILDQPGGLGALEKSKWINNEIPPDGRTLGGTPHLAGEPLFEASERSYVLGKKFKHLQEESAALQAQLTLYRILCPERIELIRYYRKEITMLKQKIQETPRYLSIAAPMMTDIAGEEILPTKEDVEDTLVVLKGKICIDVANIVMTYVPSEENLMQPLKTQFGDFESSGSVQHRQEYEFLVTEICKSNDAIYATNAFEIIYEHITKNRMICCFEGKECWQFAWMMSLKWIHGPLNGFLSRIMLTDATSCVTALLVYGGYIADREGPWHLPCAYTRAARKLFNFFHTDIKTYVKTGIY